MSGLEDEINKAMTPTSEEKAAGRGSGARSPPSDSTPATPLSPTSGSKRLSSARSSTGSNLSQGDEWSSFENSTRNGGGSKQATTKQQSPANTGASELTKLKKFSLKLKRENTDLQAKVKTLEAKVHEAESTAKETEAKLDESKAETESLRKNVSQPVSQSASDKRSDTEMKLKKLCAKLKKENAALVAKEHSLTEEHEKAAKAMEEKVKALETFVEQLEAKSQSTTSGTEELMTKVAKLETELEAAQAKAKSLEVDLIASQENLSSSSRTDDQESSGESEIATVKADLQKQIDVAKERAESAEAELLSAKEGYESSSDRHRETLSKTHEDHEKEIVKLRQDMETQISSLEASLKDAKKNSEKLKQENEEISVKLSQENTQPSEKKLDTEVSKQFEETIMKLKASHEEETATMLNTIKQSQEKIDELLEQLNVKNSELISLRDTAETESGKLQSEIEKGKSAESKIHKLKSKLVDIEAQSSQNMGDADLEIKETKTALADLAAECSTLRTRVQQLELSKVKIETTLTQEREDHSATKGKLAAAVAGASNSNMLDLEIADYKRTSETLNTRLKEMNEKLEEHEKLASQKDSTITELKSQITKEAELKKKEDESRLKLKTFLVKSKKELSEKRNQVTALERSERELREKLESSLQEIESQKTDLAELNVALAKFEAGQAEADSQRDVAVHSLKFELESVKRELAQSKTQFNDAQQELQNYKARAHTLLKQKREEPDPTGDQIKELQTEVDTVKKCLENCTAERDDLRGLCDDLEADCDDLSAKVSAAEEETNRLKNQLIAKDREHDAAKAILAQENMDALTQLRMENSLVVRGQKERLAKQSSEHEKLRANLERELEQVKSQLADAVKTTAKSESLPAESVDKTKAVGVKSAAPSVTTVQSDMAKYSSTSTPQKSNPEARSSPKSNPVADLATLLTSQVVPIGEAAVEITPQEKELAAARTQLKHLSTLLADSESTCERLEEQSKVLKSEIRRQETNSERAEGANLEYLKNVIFKFITAQEEREHLIPALGMMLKFTKEEIADATKGFKKNKAAAEAAAATANSSTYNFFPQW